nr:NnrS family protein [Halomonas campaniensis]
MAASSTPAWRWFFPLAALHAALLVPLSLLSLYHPAGVALLASPAAHGRELMFGFALAVIAGYLLGPLSHRWLRLLVGLWLVARQGAPRGGAAAAAPGAALLPGRGAAPAGAGGRPALACPAVGLGAGLGAGRLAAAPLEPPHGISRHCACNGR